MGSGALAAWGASAPVRTYAGRGAVWLGRRLETTTAFGIMSATAIAALISAHSFHGLTSSIGSVTSEPASDVAYASLPAEDSGSTRDTISAPEQPAADQPTETLTLKPRETLGGLLKRAGINNQNAHIAVTALSAVADLRRLRAGTDFMLTRRKDDSSRLSAMRFRRAFDMHAGVRWDGDRFVAEEQPIAIRLEDTFVSGPIKDSLYLTAKRLGAPDQAIHEMIRLMSFDVDFQRDIWPGDEVDLLFTLARADGYGDTEVRDIQFARLALRDKPIEATRFTDSTGKVGYFDADGSSTQKALMKTPVNGARLSSGYGKRKHPILGYTRLHKGLDFAAPRGTPIMAAGDGVVEVAGRNGGYGNYVRIRHGAGYKTAYGHMNGFAKDIKAGRRVEQGQVIGYIGSTGRSTGPHLHYEILKGGTQVNPRRLKLPDARTLAGAELAAFQAARAALIAQAREAQSSPLLAASGALRGAAAPQAAADQ